MPNYSLMLEIAQFGSLFIVPVGLVGNILLFIIYSRGSLRQLSISIYFRSIALVNLFITLNMIKVFFRDKYQMNLADLSPLACKLIYFAIYIAGPVSSWTMVAITLDRLLTLAWPMRFSFLARTRFQLLVIATVYLFNMLYYAHLLFDARVLRKVKNETEGDFVEFCDITHDKLLYWLDLINSSLLPFASMMVTSVITIVFILRSRRKFTVRKQSSATVTAFNRRMLRDRKFALTSVSLNFLFLLFNVPAPFYGVLSTFIDDIDVDLSNLIGYVCLCCYYSYYAISFFVQLTVNSIVRERFLKLIMFEKKKLSISPLIKNNSVTSVNPLKIRPLKPK